MELFALSTREHIVNRIPILKVRWPYQYKIQMKTYSLIIMLFLFVEKEKS
jgi:hypothetical protein